MGIQTKWPTPTSRTYPNLACRTVMIVAARSPVPSTTEASIRGRKKMDARLIDGSPAIHGHQPQGTLNIFLIKSNKAFKLEGPFLMYTDTFAISSYLVSIPFSLICSFTASMGTSSLWKIPVARAASTSVFSKTSEKCSTFPAPLEAITGIETFSLMCFTSSMSKPLFKYYIEGGPIKWGRPD